MPAKDFKKNEKTKIYFEKSKNILQYSLTYSIYSKLSTNISDIPLKFKYLKTVVSVEVLDEDDELHLVLLPLSCEKKTNMD